MVDFVKLNEDENHNNKRIRRSRPNMRLFSFKSFLLIFIFLFILSSIFSSIVYNFTPKIAVVPITGPIMTDKGMTLFGSSVSSRDIAQTLRSIGNDNSVKAVLLDINSPGGSPVASDEISTAIDALKKKKPVYALIDDIGASGAFWVAVSANKIYASPMSTVGSIGVTSAGLGFEDFIKEHNITYRQLTAGKYKDIGTPFRKMTPEENKMLQAILDNIYNRFIQHVAVSRNMTKDKVRKYANGQIFLGSKAKKIGFIDNLGYYPNVISALENKTHAKLIVNYGPQPSLLETLGLSTFFDWSPSTKSQILLQ